MADITLVVDSTDIQESRQAIKAWGKDVRDSITGVNRNMSLYQKEVRRVSAEEKATLRTSMALQKQKSAATAAQGREVERLTQKYKPMYAASKQYERALEEINSAHKLGIINLKQHEIAVESLTAEYQQFQNGTAGWSNQFAKGMNTAGRSANRMGMATQQAGYQVGDFIVQVQSGANPFVAFGQQATQLVGVLGMMKPSLIGLSAGLGIAIPLVTAIGAAFYRSNQEAKEAAEGVESFENQLKSAREEVRGMEQDLVLMNSGFENMTELTLNRAIDEARDSLKEVREELEELTSSAALTGVGAAGGIDLTSLFSGDRVENAEEAVRQAEYELAVLEEIQRQIEQRNRDESVTNQLHQVRQDLQRANRESAAEDLALAEETLAELYQQSVILELINQYGEDSAQVAAERARVEKEVFLNMVDTWNISEDLKEELIAAYEAGAALSVTDVGAGIRDALPSARELRDTLLQARGARIDALVNNPDFFDPRNESGTSGVIPVDRPVPPQNRAGYRAPSGGSRGTSGGGSGSAREAQKTLSEIEAEILAREKLAAAVGTEGDILRMIEDIKGDLGDAASKYSEEELRASAERIVAYQGEVEALEAVLNKQQELTDNIASEMGDALLAIVDRTKTVEEAFRDMARNIVKELYEVVVMQRVVGSWDASTGQGSGLSGVLGGLIGGISGNFSGLSTNSLITPHAKGGVVTTATMFSTGGGLGVMGEAGPEAIMPLTKTSGGELGVRVDGNSSGGDIEIHQHFSFTANGDESVKKIIAEAAPQIAQLTKKTIIDDRRRGGSTKQAFG